MWRLVGENFSVQRGVVGGKKWVRVDVGIWAWEIGDENWLISADEYFIDLFFSAVFWICVGCIWMVVWKLEVIS